MIGLVTGVVLAAGTSSRLGEPKQLLDFNGRPLLQHAVDAMEASGLFDIVVVLGHRADDVRAALELGPGTRVVVNPDYAEGQATSLRAGLRAAGEGAQAVVVILGDQPDVTGLMVRTVVEMYFATGAKIVQGSFDGKPNHPTLFDRELWPELEAVEGDQGAREVLKKHPESTVRVEFGVPVPQDLDTWEDYERLRGGKKANPQA